MKRGQSHAAEPQPQLQAWLQQQQGLAASEADQSARRLVRVFGSQQAALDGVPATFEWCRGQGLTGPQTAALLDRIASRRHDNVVQFASTAQANWKLLDSCIATYIEPLDAAGARLPKHTSLAGVPSGGLDAVQALQMPPGHVAAWLAAIGERLSDTAIGRLLLRHPSLVSGSPDTAVAAIDWAERALGPRDPAAFFAVVPSLLKYRVETLQLNLDSLQQTLAWTPEDAR